VNGRGLAFIACSLLLSGALGVRQASALDIAKSEIESTQNKDIVFVNYEGPQNIVQSLAEITGIGRALGSQIAAGSTRTAPGRYQVIRAVDPAVPQGFDADILVLGADAGVDHIRNLRWIIAGYLETAWGYSEKDAFTLATFVTVYNAVYRGDMAYISSKYKPVVQKELTAQDAGLALVYSEWPGKSRIIIPLGVAPAPGKLGAVDTSAVGSPQVTESLRAQSDKGIPERQAMTGLKEREAAQKQAEVDKQKAELAAAQEKLAADQAKLEAEKAAAKAAAQPAPAAAGTAQQPAPAAAGTAQQPAPAAVAQAATPAAATAPAAATPAAPGATAQPAAPTAAQAAAAPAAPQSAQMSTSPAAVAAQEQQVAADQAAVAAKTAQVQQGEAAVAAKKAEVAQERAGITQDQKAVIAGEVAAKSAAAAAGLYLLQIVDPTTHLGRLVFVDTGSGNLIRASRVNAIHPRSLVDDGTSFVAVAGLAGKPGGVRLARFDKTSLEDVADSSVEVFPEGVPLSSGGAFYAPVPGSGGALYLARFDASLKETARSKVEVDGYAVLAAGAGGIVAQEKSGAFAVLKADSLELVKELKP